VSQRLTPSLPASLSYLTSMLSSLRVAGRARDGARDASSTPRTRSIPAPDASDGITARGRGLVLWPSIITAFILLSWCVASAPLRDMATGHLVDDAMLVRPAAYIALAPICDVLDALTLLSVRQTLVLLASIALIYATWRIVRRGRGGSIGRRIARETLLALAVLGVVLVVYAVGVLVPRPMAALRLTDPDLIAVDFHSHTNASHDGRGWFTARRNREWHQAAGFDAAYVTDHKSFAGAVAAVHANPPRADDGTVLFSGLEYVWEHNHVNALGVTVRDFTSPAAVARGEGPAAVADTEPQVVLIQTIPDALQRTHAADANGRGGVLGIELSDGSPRGIEQAQRDHAALLHIADSLNLAVVAGSDNHGWGRTAVAWSVLRIPGWRALTPQALGAAIEQTIRAQRRHAARVIGRRSPDPGRSMYALVATLPAVTATMLVALSPAERLSWVVWVWAVAALALLMTRRGRGARMTHR